MGSRCRLTVWPLVLALCTAGALAQSDEKLEALDRQAEEFYRCARFFDAIALVERALDLAERRFGPSDPEAGDRLLTLAQIYEDQRRDTEALLLRKRAFAIYAEAFPDDPPDAPLAYMYLDEEKKLLFKRARQKTRAARDAQ